MIETSENSRNSCGKLSVDLIFGGRSGIGRDGSCWSYQWRKYCTIRSARNTPRSRRRPVRVKCQSNCTVEIRQTYRGLPRTESPAVLQPAAWRRLDIAEREKSKTTGVQLQSKDFGEWSFGGGCRSSFWVGMHWQSGWSGATMFRPAVPDACQRSLVYFSCVRRRICSVVGIRAAELH